MSHTPDHEHVLDDVDNAIAVDEDETGTVRVFVSKKLPERDVPDGQLVAENAGADDTPTDVVEIGEVRFEVDLPGFDSDDDNDSLLHHARELFMSEGDRHDRHRPVPTGVSEMPSAGTAATGGPLAKVTTHTGRARWDSSADAEYVRVSNCHVYGLSGGADFGDPVLQPSPMDGGDSSDMVGSYVGSVPLEDGGRVDAAARTLANGLDGEEFAPHNLSPDDGEYGRTIADENQLSRGAELVKSGRTTGISRGTVQATSASVRVNYGQNRTILFRDQIITTDMSDGGDSGSAVYAVESKALTGLLFAGSDRATVMNHAARVEDALGVEFLTGMPSDKPDKPGRPDEPGERGRRVARGRVENPGAPAPFEEIDLSRDVNREVAEREYHKAVDIWLNTHFDHVEHEYYFRARRYADFMVRLTPDNPDTAPDESQWQAIEVEDSFNDISAQDDLYAGLYEIEEGHENVTPVTIIPDSEVQQPELDAYRRRKNVVIFPVGEEQSG